MDASTFQAIVFIGVAALNTVTCFQLIRVMNRAEANLIRSRWLLAEVLGSRSTKETTAVDPGDTMQPSVREVVQSGGNSGPGSHG